MSSGPDVSLRTKGGPGRHGAQCARPLSLKHRRMDRGCLGRAPWCKQPGVLGRTCPGGSFGPVSIVLETRRCRVSVMGLVAHPIHGANKSDNNPESGNYKISIYTVQTHVNWSNQLLFVQLNHSRCVIFIFRLIQQKD